MQPPSHSLTARVRDLVLAGGVLVLLAAVAIVAGMARPVATATPQRPLVEPGALVGWGIAAAVLLAFGVAFLGPIWSRREKAIAAVVFVMLILGLLALAQRSSVQTVTPPVPPVIVTNPGGHTPPPPTPHRSGANPVAPTPAPPAVVKPGSIPTAAVAVIGGVAVLVALLLIFTVRGRPGGTGIAAVEVPLSEAVAASIEDAETVADPRHAVIAAWIGMGEALARGGVPREPSEAPLEYMRRALGAVQVSQESVRRLTRLFARARFSDHPTTPAMRDEALEALRRVRDELRAQGR